ncbi:MAG TPA: YiiD C-terminal domain-containing protein [Gemmatimonadales bacterium]
MTPDGLERYLFEHIPLSRALGLRVAAASHDAVELEAPLEPNLNHQRTAFGGSLSAVAILAAWSWLRMRLGDAVAGGSIVIQSNSMEYLAPVTTSFRAVCRAPGAERWAAFERTMQRRSRARIELDAEILAGPELAAQFRGQFVAFTAASPSFPGPT